MSSKKKVMISIFLDENGKITRLPVPNRTRIPVLRYLAGKFEEDMVYSQKEVNAIIDAWHSFGDYFILRRLLIDHRFLARTADGAKYWVIKEDKAAEGADGWTEKRN
jgi:hypothetical protein